MLFPQNRYDQIVPDHIIDIAEALPVRGRQRFIARLQQLAYENTRDFLRDPERFIKTAIATVYGAGVVSSALVQNLLSKAKPRIAEFAVNAKGGSKRTKFETPDRPTKDRTADLTLDTDSKRKVPNKHPGLRGIDKMDVDSETMKPQAMISVGQKASTASNGKGHGETPISPYDFVQIGIPNVETTRLPYRLKTSISTGNLPTSAAPVGLAFRTNSIYDIVGSATFTADPTATADPLVTPYETPKWRSYFANRYQYYTVLGCDYKVMFRQKYTNGSFDKDTGAFYMLNYDAFLYKAGLQKPPTLDGGAMIPKEWKLLHTGVEYQEIKQQNRNVLYTADGTATASIECETGGGPWTVFTGHCGRDTYDHEIVEDELQQTWHKMTEVPPTPEQLVFHLQPNEFNFGSPDGGLEIDVIVELTYLVQFKDLKATYEYPTPSTTFASVGISQQSLT